MPDPVPLPARYGIAESIEDYLAECRARGLRQKTVDGAYGWPLRHLWLPWCREHGIDRPEQVDQRAVNRFVGDVRDATVRTGKARSPASVDTYGVAVSRWLRWGRGTEAPRIARSRQARILRQVVTADEFARMLAAADNDRDRVVLRLLWDTGMRASELLNLRTGDLVRYDGRWFLRVLSPHHGGGAKGSHEHLVPLPRPRELRAWLDGPRAHMEADTDHVFLSRQAHARGVRQPLTPSGLGQLVRGLAREAGITHRVYPHLFRHSAVTRMQQQGLSEGMVAAIMGYSSLAMIHQHYSQLSERDAYDALARVLAKETR